MRSSRLVPVEWCPWPSLSSLSALSPDRRGWDSGAARTSAVERVAFIDCKTRPCCGNACCLGCRPRDTGWQVFATMSTEGQELDLTCCGRRTVVICPPLYFDSIHIPHFATCRGRTTIKILNYDRIPAGLIIIYCFHATKIFKKLRTSLMWEV